MAAAAAAIAAAAAAAIISLTPRATDAQKRKRELSDAKLETDR